MSTELYNELNMWEEHSLVLNLSFALNPPLSLAIGAPMKDESLMNCMSRKLLIGQSAIA